jgi:uncharacterized membrane protein
MSVVTALTTKDGDIKSALPTLEAGQVLRPSAAALEPAICLPLWQRVFSRFFPWVWRSIAVLLVSGFSMIFMGFGGFGAAGTFVHAMMVLGIVMMAIYAHL